MLSNAWNSETLVGTLLPRESWTPFPTASDREAWSVVPEQIRQGFIDRATSTLDHEWPALPATLFLDFARTGNRRNYEHVSFRRRYALADMVIAECLEGKGRFVDDIVNGIWAICEESFCFHASSVKCMLGKKRLQRNKIVTLSNVFQTDHIKITLAGKVSVFV